MSAPATSPLFKAIILLTCSAFLFSVMGVCIRYASHSVDNATIVFFRNFIGLFIFLPLIVNKGTSFFKTEKLWMHTWRSVVGLTAMYGFFYAIANVDRIINKLKKNRQHFHKERLDENEFR